MKIIPMNVSGEAIEKVIRELQSENDLEGLVQLCPSMTIEQLFYICKGMANVKGDTKAGLYTKMVETNGKK